MKIGNHILGGENPVFIIAEVGMAHDGSLGAAHAYIDAISKTGANAVKFQMHMAEYESDKSEKFRVKIFPQDSSRYDYWVRTQFTKQQWAELFIHANENGLIFMSTPFSIEAVNFLDGLGVSVWKVGSGDLSSFSLINAMIKTGKPIIVSTGMSFSSEIDDAVNLLKHSGLDYALLQCTTSYPCPPENIGLNQLRLFSEKYSCLTGLSDHSGTIYPSIAATALGASILEVHTVFSKECFGPDTTSSVTVRELKTLVDGVRFIKKSISSDFNKDIEVSKLSSVRELFRRSAYFCRDVRKGTLIDGSIFTFKKPGDGVLEADIHNFFGRVMLKDASKGEKFQRDYIE